MGARLHRRLFLAGTAAATLPMPAIAQNKPIRIGLLTVKTGPLAWNGVLSYWVGFTTAFVWLMVTTVVTASAVKRQESEPDDDPMSQLAVRVAELEAITRVAVS